MNKQSLYVFGGTLLASTALTAAGNAAVLRPYAGTTNVVTTATIGAAPLAVEVFAATATVANTAIIGGNVSTTADNLVIDFAASFTSGFNVQLNVSNAAFTGTPSVVAYSQTSSGSLQATVVTGCSVQALPDKLLITGCTPTGASTASRADALAVVGIAYTSASALATAGTSIKLDGTVYNSAGTITFETITGASVVTSKSAAETAIQSGTSLTVDNTASPVFSKFTSGLATATLGTIHFSATGAVASDLSNIYVGAVSISTSAEVKVTHSLLTDPALVSISLGTTTATTKTTTQFVSGTVSFTVPTSSLVNAAITVTFDGTTAISASSGTASVTVTPTANTGTGIVRAVGAFSGNLATLSRGGLSVELNTLMPTAGAGSTLYRSYLRIANTSTIDGVATITVKNDVTGAAIGSFTTTVTAGATKQVSSADIEAALTTAAATGAPYKVTVSGSFNGYVQNLLWNSVTGIFTDLSGFRNGALTVDP